MLLDKDRITILRADIGPDFDDVAELFLDEIGGAIADLGSHESTHRLAAALHFVKGCALNLGFAMLARLCSEAEAGLTHGQTTVDIPQITMVFEQSLAVFRRDHAPVAQPA